MLPIDVVPVRTFIFIVDMQIIYESSNKIVSKFVSQITITDTSQLNFLSTHQRFRILIAVTDASYHILPTHFTCHIVYWVRHAIPHILNPHGKCIECAAWHLRQTCSHRKSCLYLSCSLSQYTVRFATNLQTTCLVTHRNLSPQTVSPLE